MDPRCGRSAPRRRAATARRQPPPPLRRSRRHQGSGTGMIVDVLDQLRESTQEDIVVFDRSLMPAVLAHPTNAEGVFPVDGVLMRIEVKSTLTRDGLRSALLAAADIYRMQFSEVPTTAPVLPISAVFAFGSDLQGEPTSELKRLFS